MATQFIERQSVNLLVVIQYDTQLDNVKVIDSIDISFRYFYLINGYFFSDNFQKQTNINCCIFEPVESYWIMVNYAKTIVNQDDNPMFKDSYDPLSLKLIFVYNNKS